MKTFKTLINELAIVPTVSLDKNQSDIDHVHARNEINKNLRVSMAQGYANPHAAFEKVRKILSGYGIEIPQTNFYDAPAGVKIVPISQFGAKSGAKLSGEIDPPKGEENDEDYFLYFTFAFGENGVYSAFAAVVDEHALELLGGTTI